MQRFQIAFKGPDEQRLDRFLAEALPQFTRSRLQALIRRGAVEVDGERAGKTGQLLGPGAVVTVHVPPPEPSRLEAEPVRLDVVYEDDDVLVINKPAGMVVHPGAGHSSGTLVNAALAHDPLMRGVGGERRPGVVHRLDRDTSGLIVLAKHDDALLKLQLEFQHRRVQKTYLALVDGTPPTIRGRVEANIGRDPKNRKRMAILASEQGREAISEYSLREVFPHHSLLEVYPVTGRTHQIRLHCALLGCPVVGDTVYGRKKPSIDIGRHFLHAWKLRIVLPSRRESHEFVADLPVELEGIIRGLSSTATGGV